MNPSAGLFPIPCLILIVHDARDRILLRAPQGPDGAELPGWPLRLKEDYRVSALKGIQALTGAAVEPSGIYAIVSRAVGTDQEMLAVAMLAMIPEHLMDEMTGPGAHFLAARPGAPLPPLAYDSDGSLIRRLWSGEWSVISRNAGFFSDGGGI